MKWTDGARIAVDHDSPFQFQIACSVLLLLPSFSPPRFCFSYLALPAPSVLFSPPSPSYFQLEWPFDFLRSSIARYLISSFSPFQALFFSRFLLARSSLLFLFWPVGPQAERVWPFPGTTFYPSKSALLTRSPHSHLTHLNRLSEGFC